MSPEKRMTVFFCGFSDGEDEAGRAKDVAGVVAVDVKILR